MNHGDFSVAAAPQNGKPQRLVLIERKDGTSWRDQFDTNSASSRRRFVNGAASKFGVNAADLPWLDDAIVSAADQADVEADAAVKAAQSPTDAKELLEDTPAEIKAEASAMLESPALADEISQDIQSLGVVGERSLALTLYSLGVSRLLEKPLSAIILGSSSTGKSFVLECVTRLFPPETIVSATALTPQALFYLPAGFLVHRLVVVGERSRLVDDSAAEGTRALREMLSSGRLRKLLPVRIDGQWTTRLVEQEGPIAYVESTTLSSSQIFDEDVNRSLLLSTDERRGQTEQIIAALGRAYAGEGREVIEGIVAKHHAAQRMLRPVAVVIPFAADLAREFPFDRVEARRGFPHLMNAVQAVALLHQFQRDFDGRGRLIATEDDYRVARNLVSTPLARLLAGRLSDAALQFLERLRGWFHVDEVFSTRDAKQREASSKRSVQGWLADLCEFGTLELVESNRGNKPSLWRLIPQQCEVKQWSLPEPPGQLTSQETIAS